MSGLGLDLIVGAAIAAIPIPIAAMDAPTAYPPSLATGLINLAYRNEEAILAARDDPQRYNDEVIYPDKVRINLAYIRHWRFRDDLRYIWRTVVG